MNAQKESTVAALERRLERSATSPRGVLIMTREEAQVMLEEIRRLRDNQAHRIEDYATDVTRSFSSFMGRVVLRSRAIVNGRPRQAQMEVDELAWGTYGPDFHKQVLASLRHGLVEEIVEEMDPAARVMQGAERLRV